MQRNLDEVWLEILTTMGRRKNRRNAKEPPNPKPTPSHYLLYSTKTEDISTIETPPGMIVPKPITGALCVIESHGSIMLVQDRLFQQKITCCIGDTTTETLWTLPGGGREDKGKESLAHAASRELFEETRGLLLIPPSYFEYSETIGACVVVNTHDGKRRVYYIRIMGDIDISLFDRKKKPNATFNETGNVNSLPPLPPHTFITHTPVPSVRPSILRGSLFGSESGVLQSQVS